MIIFAMVESKSIYNDVFEFPTLLRREEQRLYKKHDISPIRIIFRYSVTYDFSSIGVFMILRIKFKIKIDVILKITVIPPPIMIDVNIDFLNFL